MSKRKISAKEAVVDIRSGKDDSALMRKYDLSPAALQSLFDRLVNAGFIDLAEIEGRLRGFWGTVVISESDLASARGAEADQSQASERKSPPRINAQEAARDIRLGMSDDSLTEKYRISSRGLRSLFNKLLAAGLISQEEIDRRYLGIDDTVDLKEDMLSLSGALRAYGVGLPASSNKNEEPRRRQAKVSRSVKDSTKQERRSLNVKEAHQAEDVERSTGSDNRAWYLQPIAVSAVLITLFVLGLYALYQSRILQP